MLSILKKNTLFILGAMINNSIVYTPIRWLLGHYSDRKVNKNTELCIEGFQRSGNTFLKRLFSKYNKGISVAHHNHSSQSVIRAINRKIPTIVLIRKPEEAIASLLVWDSNLNIRIALLAYRLFYKRLIRFQNKVWTLNFDTMTQDPIKVINSLNRRFGTTFNKIAFSEQEYALFKTEMSQSSESNLDSPLPNQQKEALKKKLVASILSNPDYKKTLDIYLKFLEKK